MAKIPSLKLHDGTVIDTMTGEIMEQEIAPIVPTLSSEVSSRRRFTDLAIKGSDELEEFQEIIVDNIVEANTDEVRSTFLRHSKNAANTMITLLSSKSQEVQKSAAKDILDRAGHRPVDVSEQRIRVDGGLRIEYIQKSKDIPTIDITPNQDF